MGNRLGSRRHVVDDRYTRPQGLYQHTCVDHKKLRRLIRDSKLAPCFPGGEDRVHDMEECPICFLYYPSLNRSRCCMKGICTECFLLLKTPNSSKPTQCPFCKTSNYAVEYKGVKSKEEKGMEQIEEQRVIEARIRMRQQEINEEEERTQKRDCRISNSGSIEDDEAECISVSASSGRILQELVPLSLQHQIPQQNGEEDTDLDIEDAMVMEAIWRSIQKKEYSDNEETTVEPGLEESSSPHSSRVVADSGGSTSSSSPPIMCAAKTHTPWSEATASYCNGGGYISEFESFEERMMVAEVMSLAHLNQSGRF